MTANLETVGGRPELRFERHLAHPVERVWRALTDANELAQWFPGELKVTHSEPPRLLTGSWNGGTLRFELHDQDQGCILLFTHAFTDRDQAALAAAGWDCCFAALDAHLAGQPISQASALTLWPEVHDRYASTWGIDPEIGRAVYAEHSPA